MPNNTTDTKVDELIINTLTKAQYDDLVANNQVEANQLYLTKDEDYYMQIDVTYGTTTYAQITSALGAKQEPVCNYNSYQYTYAGNDGTYYYFTCAINSEIKYVRVNSASTWSNGTASLQTTISDLGTIRANASLGASAVQPSDLATVATTGDYTDLSNKPTIPTVNNKTITIQKNSTTVDSFTLNQSTDKTINISVPTTAADVGAQAAGNYISYTNNTATVAGTSKTVSKTNPETLFVPNGLIMGGTAAAAGLVTRGVCGVSSPTETGAATKDNLYINYDSTNTYSSTRQVVIQAGSVGTHYGNNLYQYAAARGDAVKNYADATYTPLTRKINNKALSADITLTASDVSAVASNTAITGATKCKITYDSKGLVTAGADLSAGDIPDLSATYLTSHQSIKSIKSDNTTAQSTSSSEAIAGSGTINLHKVSKTGSYNDLLNKPTIPATNVIPATTTANKVLVSTTTSGTAKWSDFSSAGFLKTNSSGVISVDTTTYGTYSKPSGGIPASDLAESYYLASNPSGYTSNAGTVTSVRVQATSPVQSSTSTAQSSTLNTTISLADGYGDTKNPYASKTKNYVLAAPSTANGAPTFRALEKSDIPLSSETAASGGTTTSLVTTGEKYTWNNKQNALTAQTAYTSKGSATKVPQITTNTLGQVTGITEIDITHPTELPSQTGQSGKFLTTNGSTVSWAAASTSIDNSTITKNGSDQIQTVGYKDVRTNNTLKTWTGTKAQYDAIATKDANTLYNITDDTDTTLTVLNTLYPVGAIYIGTMDICPLVTLGVGSWELQTSRFLVDKKEPTANDPSWYNLYSDGWCEQGGFATDPGFIEFTYPYNSSNFKFSFNRHYPGATSAGSGSTSTANHNTVARSTQYGSTTGAGAYLAMNDENSCDGDTWIAWGYTSVTSNIKMWRRTS